MRNILTAFAALGAIAISSSLFAQAPTPMDDHSVVDGVVQMVESAQADAAAPAPLADPVMLDHGVAEVQEMGQPMPQPMHQQGTIQGEHVMMEQPMAYQHQPVQYHYRQPANHYQQPAKKQNVFGKLMEMERKKNAWLRKTFLGR